MRDVHIEKLHTTSQSRLYCISLHAHQQRHFITILNGEKMYEFYIDERKIVNVKKTHDYIR